MAAAVSPFSTDHAVRFAQELLGFLSSSLSVTGHDLFVFGADVQPSQAPQNQQSGVATHQATGCCEIVLPCL